MSADNWATCPRCVKRAEVAKAAQAAKAAASYGKVSEREYAEAIAAIKDVRPEDCQTFREDYQIYGAADGAVTVDYSGHCGTCGLSLSFKETKPIPGVGD